MATWRGYWWRLPWLPAVALAAVVWGAGIGFLLGTVPVDRGGEPWGATGAVLVGVAVALVAGIVVTVGRGADLGHADGLDGRRARVAAAASYGGAVPPDPDVRAAALRMVSARFQRTAGAGRAGIAAPVVVALLQFPIHGVDSWVPWLLLIGAIGVVVSAVRAPRRLQRRILELAPPALDRRAPGPS